MDDDGVTLYIDERGKYDTTTIDFSRQGDTRF